MEILDNKELRVVRPEGEQLSPVRANLTINSTNPNKIKEYERILGRPVAGVRIPTPERQMEGSTAKAVSEHVDGGDRTNNFPYLAAAAELGSCKAQDAWKLFGGPVLVEDTSLYLHGLGGQPGPFYSQWDKKPGYNRDLCDYVHKLPDIRGKEVNDRATAVVTLAMWRDDGNSLAADVWQGVVTGRIASEPRGENGFGWDSIFIPSNDDGEPAFFHIDPATGEPLRDLTGAVIGKTFAELTPEEKDLVSMRAKALRRFLDSCR
jgi:non-canonical purine NTP pyrophosphatase (RdgB/HAM1 family)